MKEWFCRYGAGPPVVKWYYYLQTIAIYSEQWRKYCKCQVVVLFWIWICIERYDCICICCKWIFVPGWFFCLQCPMSNVQCPMSPKSQLRKRFQAFGKPCLPQVFKIISSSCNVFSKALLLLVFVIDFPGTFLFAASVNCPVIDNQRKWGKVAAVVGEVWKVGQGGWGWDDPGQGLIYILY